MSRSAQLRQLRNTLVESLAAVDLEIEQIEKTVRPKRKDLKNDRIEKYRTKLRADLSRNIST